jgi:hypothetical protein
MLIDVVFETHGYGNTDFNTYIRGNRCIDYMLVDRQLMQAVQYCGYEPFNIRIMGDHRGIFVNMSTADMFGSETMALPPLALRDYCTKNIHQTAPFINDQFQHLDGHAWFQHINDLQECMDKNEPNHALANKLDQQRIATCQYAGKKLKRYGPTPYSPALIQQKTICKQLKIAVRRHKMGWTEEESTVDIHRKLQDVGITLPADINGCKQVQNINSKN